MCFSAGASFGASAVLSIIGTAAIMRAKTVPQGLFAGIPMIFSIQQLAEGMLWLSLKDPQFVPYQSFFIYAFLGFALVLWPVWIPLTIRMLEKDAKRKRTLTFFVLTGALVSAATTCAMCLYPTEVMSAGHHLHYEIGIPPATTDLIKLFTILYVAATILSTFVSSHPRMKWLGITFLFSYTLSVFFYSGSVVSVWCYFAALLSLVVFWIIVGLQQRVGPVPDVNPT